MQRFIRLMRVVVTGKTKDDPRVVLKREKGGEGGHEAWRGKRGRFLGVHEGEDETMDAVAIYD